MQKRRFALALFALLAIAAVVVGCGGGGSSSDTSGSTTGGSTEAETGGSTEAEEGGSTEEAESPESGGAAPSKAAFIKEGDEVCAAAEEELGKEITDFAKENDIPIENEEEPNSDQETELFQEVVLPNIARQGEELAALTPPEGDEGTIEELTDALAEEVSDAESSGGKPDNDTLAGATKIAKEYGFKVCGA